MTTTPGAPARSAVDWPRYLCGLAVAVVAAIAVLGLLRALLSQVVLFGEYEGLVEAELRRPTLVPSLLAAVATAGAGLAWRRAFGRRSAPRWAAAPFLAAAVVLQLVALAVDGPTEAALERRWEARLAELRLPDAFRPTGEEPYAGAERYEASRRWTTDLDPGTACAATQQALSAWLGTTVERLESGDCYLSAAVERDTVSAILSRSDDSGIASRWTLWVRLSYRL